MTHQPTTHPCMTHAPCAIGCMQQDRVRGQAYAEAMFRHGGALFKGKRVMDVGAGSGVLSMYAALAGAAKVGTQHGTQHGTHDGTQHGAQHGAQHGTQHTERVC